MPNLASGPLRGVRVVEFGAIGPAPYACMVLADLGADVVRIDRPSTVAGGPADVLGRGKRSVLADLKSSDGLQQAKALACRADAVIEGFRPGVMERLGLGPDTLLAINPSLIYGRMTGWGQYGPLAHAAGHDVNYIAITGALAAIGPGGGRPVPPLNLVGDYGGGALFLLVGVLSALLERQHSGRGQVVDAAMCDGAASLMSHLFGKLARGEWRLQRQSNLLDGGAHCYGTYECADGKYVALASLEPQFYALLREKLGLQDARFDAQLDPAAWPSLTAELAAIFRTRPRQHWCDLLEGSDACFAPVLDMAEAPMHPHNTAREVFVSRQGVVQPQPAPRFSRTPGVIQGDPPVTGSTRCDDVLAQWSRPD